MSLLSAAKQALPASISILLVHLITHVNTFPTKFTPALITVAVSLMKGEGDRLTGLSLNEVITSWISVPNSFRSLV